MRLQRGDHICALYSTPSELIEIVSDYLVDGLLYDRHRMPLNVIDGALATHPIVRARGGYIANEFYDASVTQLSPADETTVLNKLEKLAN